jgi:DNA-binding PadR family transcriptional regulator
MNSNHPIESYLPLTPALFHVLLALADGGKHGYAILKDVSFRTGDEVRLSTGTLYGIIKRLLNEGLIEESRRRPAAEHDDERRIYYHLTTLGQRVAAAEAERHEKIVALARLKKVLRRPRIAAS